MYKSEALRGSVIETLNINIAANNYIIDKI